MSENQQDIIRRYLLGGLDEATSAQVEERLLTDQAFYEELSIREDEITDEYLEGQLSDSERRGFETHFLSANERREKLRFARNLKHYVREATSRDVPVERVSAEEPGTRYSEIRPRFGFLPFRNPLIAYSLVAVAVLAIFGASWVFLSTRGSRTGDPESFVTVNLTPGSTRSDGNITSIRIPPGTGSVRLQLTLPANEYQSYQAELLTSDRTSVLLQQNLKAETLSSGKAINLTVPVGLLKRDDYRAKVSGLSSDGSYNHVASYSIRILP